MIYNVVCYDDRQKGVAVLAILGGLGRAVVVFPRRPRDEAGIDIDAFFDAYLKGPGIPRLELLSPQYPEIQVSR